MHIASISANACTCWHFTSARMLPNRELLLSRLVHSSMIALSTTLPQHQRVRSPGPRSRTRSRWTATQPTGGLRVDADDILVDHPRSDDALRGLPPDGDDRFRGTLRDQGPAGGGTCQRI